MISCLLMYKYMMLQMVDIGKKFLRALTITVISYKDYSCLYTQTYFNM